MDKIYSHYSLIHVVVRIDPPQPTKQITLISPLELVKGDMLLITIELA